MNDILLRAMDSFSNSAVRIHEAHITQDSSHFSQLFHTNTLHMLQINCRQQVAAHRVGVDRAIQMASRR